MKYALPNRLNKHDGPVSYESIIHFLDNFGSPLVMEYGEETTMIIFEKEYQLQAEFEKLNRKI